MILEQVCLKVVYCKSVRHYMSYLQCHSDDARRTEDVQSACLGEWRAYGVWRRL